MAGLPRTMGTGGGVQLAGDQSAGADNAVVADLGAVKQNGAHADQSVVSHSAAMDDGAVPHRAVGAHHCPGVENGSVLNIRVLAYFNGGLVAPDHGVVPYAVAFGQRDVSYYHSTFCNQHIRI